MKTKIGLPFGLALVVFIGVFTTMLALGALNPQPAEAAFAAPDLKIDTSDNATYARADWTFTVKNDGTAISENTDDTLDIVFPPAGTGGFDLSDTVGIGAEANWSVMITGAGGTAQADLDRVDSIVNLEEVSVSGQTIMVDLISDAASIPSGEMDMVNPGETVEIKFTAPKAAGFPTGGIINPTTATEDIDIQVDTNSVFGDDMTQRIDIVSKPANVVVNNDPNGPGHVGAGYRIDFYVGTDLTANLDSILVRFDKDIGDPPLISRTAVLITADSVTPTEQTPVANNGIAGQATPLPSSPTHGLVNSLGTGDDPGDKNIAEYKLTLPDLDARPEVVAGIQAGAHVTVAFGPGAGLKNPTEAGSGDKVSVGLSTQGTFASDNIVVPLVLEIDDVKDKRDTPITITGKGFKNGTTATIWVEKMTEGNEIGVRDENEIDIISVDVASDDTFEVTINVSVPPFAKGAGNLINAIDREQPTPNTFKTMDQLLTFHVDDSIIISPTTANVGDTVRVQVRDWPVTGAIAAPAGEGGLVTIAEIAHGPTSLTIDELGNATFDIVIQNGVPVGRSELRLDDGPNDAEASIVIGGANLTVRPETVVPNQSVLVTGRGFSRGGKINGPAPSGSDADGDNSLVSLSGNSNGLKAKGGAQSARINADETIDVDSGGNWSANIVIPMTSTSVVPSAGTTASVLELKIADDDGREGTVDLSISPRSITLNPAESRVGTDITVTGTGFPADNPATEADTVPVVNIEYNVGGTNPWRRLGSVQPDSSGSFTGTFRVPSTAVLPSTNTVRAHFTITEENADGTSVNLPYESTAVHNVPEGGISLSIAEGTPGTEVTVTGQGFKAFRTLESIEFGILEVTPAPKPITNATGGFATAFVVPGLDVGTHNVEVTISETVASAPFRILAGDAPVTPEVMMAEAATPEVAFAAVIAEDNLIAVYHFDPATQNEAPNYGYTVYDARPLFMSGNNLDSIEPGQFYTVQVSEDQMGVTLGSQTVDLYASFTPIRW